MRENGYLNGISVCPHSSFFILHYSFIFRFFCGETRGDSIVME
jgi:hypothetical protein